MASNSAKPVNSANTVASPKMVMPVQRNPVLKNAPMMITSDQTISGVIPAEGTRGTVITISGQKFGNSTSDVVVKVNGVAAIVTGISDNQILAIVPDKAGSGPIAVAVKGKWASGAGFTYDWNGAINFMAGVSANSPGYADGTGAGVKFNHPTGLARDAQGYIYIADCENNRIRKMNNFGEVTTIAGNGAIGSADGTGASASFHYPTTLAVDAYGNIYVADDGNHLVRKITPSGMVTTLAGNAGGHFADGTGRAAGFGSLRGGVCIDGSNNIYVGDGTTIRKITPAGVVTTLVRGFGNIVALIFNNNELYVADGKTVCRVSLSGSVSLIAGSKDAYRGVDGYGAAAQFSSMLGMAMDAAGTMYVTEQNGDDYPPTRIRRVSKDGFVQTIGNTGTGTGLLAGSVGDAANSFYLADRTWNCIRKVTIQ
ncbi:IPT/TIG domain-containing protein [Flavitalea flava]